MQRFCLVVIVSWLWFWPALPAQSVVHSAADWSPDGKRLLFWSDWEGNLDVYTVGIDGSGLTNLTRHPAEDANPVWSPDGTRIAFYSKRSGRGDIYVMNADGSGLQNLTNHPAPDHNPSWSPDGREIAFQSYRDGRGQIYRMRADGADQRLVRTTAGNDTNPDWSPDGKRILFVSDRGPRRSIFVMDADGGGTKELVSADSADLLNPKWAPDGRWFTFHSLHTVGELERGAIFTAYADGSHVLAVTHDSTYCFNPFVSPDGGSLSFNRASDGVISIWTMDADGSNARRVTGRP